MVDDGSYLINYHVIHFGEEWLQKQALKNDQQKSFVGMLRDLLSHWHSDKSQTRGAVLLCPAAISSTKHGCPNISSVWTDQSMSCIALRPSVFSHAREPISDHHR